MKKMNKKEVYQRLGVVETLNDKISILAEYLVRNKYDYYTSLRNVNGKAIMDLVITTPPSKLNIATDFTRHGVRANGESMFFDTSNSSSFIKSTYASWLLLEEDGLTEDDLGFLNDEIKRVQSNSNGTKQK